jgi:AcrR family transcriptional regulator
MTEMTSTPVRKKGSARLGRPPRELAGEVEERILDAARKVFLERGFEGASVDEIAETARAGKPTIYARFPNKQALFAATLMRHLTDKHTRVASYPHTGTTLEERLASIGVAILRETLTAEGVGLGRLAIAEARNFPDLGSSICQLARERGAETVARLLGEVSECGKCGTSPEFSQDHHKVAARYFLDLIVLPKFIRALSGENIDMLRENIVPYVSDRVAFFLAACRHGGIR